MRPITVLASFLLCSTALPALAQTVPPSAAPENQQQRFDRELSFPEQQGDFIDQKPAPEPKQADKLASFTLNHVEFYGNGLFSDETLMESVRGYIGEKVTLQDVRAMTNAITAQYRREGYILSRAYLPPQRIENGVVEVRVIEGYVRKVTIAGVEGSDNELVQKYASKIQSDGPLNVETLERYLLLADDLPGITARGVMTPVVGDPGATDLTVVVSQKKWEGAVQLDNRGNRFLGPVQLTGLVAANSVFAAHDRTSVRSIVSAFEPEELQFIDITHEHQIGTEGTKLIVRAANTDTEPGAFLEQFDVEGESQRLEISLEHPFIRSRAYNVSGRVGFEYVDASTDIAGVELYDDKVRTIVLGAAGDYTDAWRGINLGDLELRKGVNVFGATDTTGAGRSRFDGESDFTSLRFNASRLQDLPGHWSVLAATSGQYSLDPLLSSEEFTIGGPAFGSAYDSSEISGDHGLAGRLELRYGRATEKRWLDSYLAYAFYDLGAVWERDAPTGFDDRQSLASAGFGTRLNAPYDWSGFIELAFPLTRDVRAESSEGDEPRIFAGVTKRF